MFTVDWLLIGTYKENKQNEELIEDEPELDETNKSIDFDHPEESCDSGDEDDILQASRVLQQDLGNYVIQDNSV